MPGKRVLLLWPPASSLLGPPLGLAAVAGYLRHHCPDVEIRVEDVNARVGRAALAAVPRTSELHRLIRSRWTGAETVQDALSCWAFGTEAPGSVGALPDWERHFLAILFGEVMQELVEGIDRSPDVIGLSVCDNGLVAAIGLTRRLRRRFPRATIVWGGVSVTAENAPRLLEHVSELDAAVVGEGERALVAIVSASPDLPRGHPGVLVRGDRAVARAPRSSYLPHEPAYDLFDLALYPALELPVSIARGCAWGKCTFCNENYAASTYQPIDQERSARWALEWQGRYRPVSIELVDSSANLPPKGFRRFVDCLLEGGGLREWRCMMRTPGLDAADLERAARAGLRTVYFGLESFDDAVLARMRKGATAADHLRAIALALEAGLGVEGDLIQFFPTDEAKAVRRTIDLVRRFEHLFSRVRISFSRFVPGLQSDVARAPGAFAIELLPTSQRLARHLPPSLVDAFVPWDPHWRFIDRNPREVAELAAAYLELEATLAALRKGPALTREWTEGLDGVVLETLAGGDNSLERVFLSEAQRRIWEALERPLSSARLAAAVSESRGEVTRFATALRERGFLAGNDRRWTRAAPRAGRVRGGGVDPGEEEEEPKGGPAEL